MDEASERGVDVSGLNADLTEAGRAIEAFANGPAKAAGEALEQAFAKAGRSIRSELEQLARSGEADLDRLAAKLVETLAQLAVRQVFGGSERAGPVNVTMNVAGNAGASDVVGSGNQIAAMVARAVRKGARFS